MRKIVLSFVIITSVFANSVYPQSTDTTKRVEKPKSGLNIGALPAISFDSDLGFQYGLIGNLFNYGDGSYYPDYKWSLYGQWSQTTKGNGTNQLYFDSKYLLPHHIRITADFSLLTEKALTFYGFNGFEAAYHPEFEDDDVNNNLYISRMYYNYEWRMFRMSIDLQGALYQKHFKWLAGYGRYDTKVGSVDIEKLNKGLDEDKKLPAVDGLYDQFVDWGFISSEEADGGAINTLKLGLVYDTRDNESIPQHGMWAEALLMTAPRFFGNKESAYTKLALIYRHYVPVVANKLTFAYRLGWQGTVSGKCPFYMDPFLVTSSTKVTINEGLGGAKSLRGILRNRVVGDGISYANLELRYKLMEFNKWNQNFYIGLNGFGDFGMVTTPVDFNKANLPVGELYSKYFDQDNDQLHASYGAGLKIAMNRNFVLSLDYGRAADKRDGTSGLYINIGYLF